ncbi:MAG: hypothetical protein HY552_02850 [Elusimicrobia bacterium]|nr:hypothetical protein [Elusimicrobiota bacterium]
MNAKILAAALCAVMLSASARAEEAPAASAPAPAVPASPAAPDVSGSVMTFFRHLKSSLSQSAVSGERKKARGAAVAAVRGRSQASDLADPDQPALKGDRRSRRDRLAAAEDAELEKAVDLILAGKLEDGIKALEAFKAAHPKSRSLKSAEEALQKAKELAAPAAEPAAKG